MKKTLQHVQITLKKIMPEFARSNASIPVEKIVIEPHTTVVIKECFEQTHEQQQVLWEGTYTVDVQITLGAHAHVTYHLQPFVQAVHTSALSRSITRRLTFILAGDYSQVTCTGQLHVTGKDEHNIRVLQIHTGTHTVSTSSIRMVLDDQAQVGYSGKVLIEKSAQRANAVQEYKALVVSDQARATAQPELEILNNDVTCKHGVAIAYINKEYLLYLMTRGLNFEDSKKLILQSFLSIES